MIEKNSKLLDHKFCIICYQPFVDYDNISLWDRRPQGRSPTLCKPLQSKTRHQDLSLRSPAYLSTDHPISHTRVSVHVSVHVSILLKHVYLYCAITCGMMVSRERKSCSPRVAMSTPSMVIFPPALSRIRNKANVNDDFPAPVRPTMPICWN